MIIYSKKGVFLYIHHIETPPLILLTAKIIPMQKKEPPEAQEGLT